MSQGTATAPRTPAPPPPPRRRHAVRRGRALKEPVPRPPPSTAEKLSGPVLILLLAILSFLAHYEAFVAAAAYGALQKLHPPAHNQKIEVAVVEKKPPPPPPPEPEKKPEPPKPPPKKIVKMVKPPPEPVKMPPPPPDAPPPPPDVPPTPPPPTQQAANPNPAPIPIVGITLSSTSTAGAFAMNVGNTTMGQVQRIAQKPEDVKPYKAEKFVPAYQLEDDEMAKYLENVSNDEAEKEYPPEAKKDDVEDEVKVEMTVDGDGSVVAVKVLDWIHKNYKFDEAAKKLARKYRFKPAKKNGQPVATVIPFTIRFELPY